VARLLLLGWQRNIEWGRRLRSSLALSLITGRSFRIENIRKKRSRPGLLRQHLTAVRAAATVGSADVEGDELGSTDLEFHPGEIRAGDYRFAIGTAGSTTLVFQTVFPALLRADGESKLLLEGGTHNAMAPPFEFLAEAYLPLLKRMGVDVDVKLRKPGFAPAGGGSFYSTIRPPAALTPIEIGPRGSVKRRFARAIVADLPKTIAEREVRALRGALSWPKDSFRAESIAGGPGNVILVEIESDECCEVFSGFGARGVTAERVAKNVVKEVKSYLKGSAAVGE
ncbi:MAG: RNA 3'-terminal phosphate cyclase, partial [Planctomycetota bacterium]